MLSSFHCHIVYYPEMQGQKHCPVPAAHVVIYFWRRQAQKKYRTSGQGQETASPLFYEP